MTAWGDYPKAHPHPQGYWNLSPPEGVTISPAEPVFLGRGPSGSRCRVAVVVLVVVGVVVVVVGGVAVSVLDAAVVGCCFCWC